MRDVNSLNKVILVGHLGRNPEARVFPQSGRKVVRFSLATSERYFNKSTNEAVKKTEWHKIVVWGPLADFCEKYLSTGKQILVEGKIKTEAWQDKDGNKRSTTEIEAQNIVLLGRREEAGREEGVVDGPSGPDFPMEGDETAHSGGGGGGDDDIPF
jgi:single-strand DNA-binding protein